MYMFYVRYRTYLLYIRGILLKRLTWSAQAEGRHKTVYLYELGHGVSSPGPNDVLTTSLVVLLRAAVSGLGGAALGGHMHARGTARVPA